MSLPRRATATTAPAIRPAATSCSSTWAIRARRAGGSPPASGRWRGRGSAAWATPESSNDSKTSRVITFIVHEGGGATPRACRDSRCPPTLGHTSGAAPTAKAGARSGNIGEVLRLAYVLGAGYVALCSLLVARRQPAAPAPVIAEAPPAASGGWFAAVRPRCNAVEVALAMSSMPPPRGQEGYQASCYALAGKIDEARRILATLPPAERGHATQILFEVVHPVADAGDDRSAGPMMRLVLEHWPDNYMALYHA